MDSFHFLRPLWLLAILPCALLLWALWHYYRPRGNWQQVIDSELLPSLTNDTISQASRTPLVLAAIAWLVSIVALAGPSWQQLPQPSYQKQDALIILLDLSPSMYATDIKPSRLVQAQREIRDILKLRNEGLTALIAYSGDAHVVTPLTDDTETIELLLPALAPAMMPSIGNQPLAALELAAELLTNSPSRRARVLFVSDEIPAADFKSLQKLAAKHQLELSILGIGTESGAPIPLTQGGFLKNSRGEVVVAGLNSDDIEDWADTIGARYQPSTYSDRDIDSLLRASLNDPALNADASLDKEQQFDTWLDAGPWLLLAVLPLAILGFRRGWLLALVATTLMLPAEDSYALSWKDLWQSDDQQAQRLLQQQQAEEAAETFADEQWRGVAQYRAGDYGAAAQSFAQEDSSTAHYNRGNALAQAGELEAALSAYERALELDPENADAASNKQQVEEALEQQKQQQSNDGEGDDQDQNQDQDQDQDDSKRDEDSGDPGDSSENQGSESQNQGDSDEAASNQAGQQQDDASSNEQPGDDAEDKNSEDGTNDDTEEQASAAQQSEQEQQQQQSGENAADASANSEQDERLKQWLRQIPDEPGDLLQRKFNYQYRQQQSRGGGDNVEERY